MKIILGSRNKDKVKITIEALKELHIDAEVVGATVDPEITTQPLDKETTKKGAQNRARNAKDLNPNTDFWMGLEGGLHDYGKGYHLVTYACLIHRNGNEYIDEGEEIHLPPEVSKKVKGGEWFGNVIREYAKDHEVDENLITRLSPFTRAVQSSYVEYLKQTTDLEYRNKSSAVVVDNENNYLIVQLIGYGKDDWNFPGGGIEKGETAEQAVLRELKEELGTDKFEITKKSKHTHQYEWPNWLIARDIGKKNTNIYRGQKATFFLVNFHGRKRDIKPDPNEIKKIKWVKRHELKDHFNFSDQLRVTKTILKDLSAA